MRDDDATLLDLAAACRLVLEFSAGFDRETFLRDRKTQSAVLHQLLLLGEGAKRLSDEFRAEHGAIDWRSIAGMRDKLIHQYDQVDIEQVWLAVAEDVPRLSADLAPLLPTEDSD